MKKHLKWIIPVAVLVVAAAVVLGVLFLGGKDGQTADSAGGYKIAWNVDGTVYIGEDGLTTRIKGGDNYRARFAVDGEQIDLFFTDTASMSLADTHPFVAVKYDENYVVTDVKDVLDVTGGLGAWNYYIESVSDTEILCNSTANFKGVPVKVRINENTKCYNVGGEGLLVGLSGEPVVGGQLYAILDHDGIATHLFVTGAFEASPVYWNVTRKYDSTSKMTTRSRDELGYFVYDMVVDGQPIQLKTMDMAVANQVDSFGAKCMHLTFNEDGTIASAMHARNATGGNSAASWYHVLEYTPIDGKFSAEKFSGSDKGATGTWTMTNDCKIYDMSGKGAYIGEETELQVYDQVHGLTNPAGDVCILFIVSRSQDCDLYYNLERKWDSASKTSTRTPDADGWYHFEFSVNGEHVSLKTKDAAIVETIDSRAARVLGLELDGDVITAAYAPSAVSGSNSTAFDYTVVTAINGNEITATRNGKTYTATMAADCEIYNVSSTAGVVGEKTTVQVGDTIYGLAGFDKKVNEIYVTKRAQYSHLYWNLDRNYDSATKQTNRTPDADGYYWFRFVDDGEIVTYKTASKQMADKIDSFVAIGMQYSGDLITSVFKYDQINGLTGGGFASWKIVTSISGNTIKAGDQTGTMSSRVKVYNVSASAIVPGEETEVRVGDRIHGIKDSRGKIMYIFVVGRAIEADLYYNVERMWQDGATTRTSDADGYYSFLMAVNGQQVTLKTDDIDIVNTIDGRAAQVLGLVVDGDVIKAAYKPSEVSGSETTTFDFAEVTEIAADGTITAIRGDKTYTGKPAADCEIYNVSAAADMIGEVTTVEVGDTIYGFENKNGEVTEIYVIGRTPKTQTKTDYCDVCEADVVWTEWAGTSFEEGHYYLTKDMDIKSTAAIAEGTKVCLDLNGHDVIGASSLDRIFNIYGELNLLDEKKSDGSFDGDVITNYNNSSSTRVGNVFYIQNKAGAAFNMYGGNLKSTGTVSKGKIGGITRTMNIYDGTISGGTVTGYGGALRLEAGTAELNIYGGTLTAGSGTAANGGGVIYMNGGKVNMSGGTIVGGTVKTNGGAVCIDGNSAVFTLSGGTITGGSAANGGTIQISKGTFKWTGGTLTEGTATNGNSIASYGKVILSGTVSLNGVYMYKTDGITAENLNAASRIGVTMAEPGVFLTCTDAATAQSLKDCFISEDTAYTVSVDGASLTLAAAGTEPEPAPTGHTHCVCGDNTKGVGDHTSCTTQTWEVWTGTWESGKYYYLNADYDCTSTISITKNQVLNLCLNGHKFNGSTSIDRIFNVYGTLNICDHKVEDAYTGKIVANKTNTASSAKTGAVFYTQNSSTSGYGVVNLYGGILTATGKVYKGGVCGLGNDLNMYDGVITGGKAQNYGGNIFMESNSYSTFNMYGGTVSDGQATGGGNLRTGYQVNLLGGTITGGTCNGSGGNIRVDNGTLTIDGTTISGGSSTDYSGGNIFVNGGKLLLKSGSVYNGSAVTGGNIAIKATGSAISGGSIYGGTATDGGNDIYFEEDGGTLTLSGTIGTNGGTLDVYVKLGTVVTTDLSTTVKIKITEE